MSALIDLGFCPYCFEDLHDSPSSVIINALFCKICADKIRGNRQVEEWWLQAAKEMKERIDE